ncbi:YbaN family protein [Colwellia sp. RE-S-Sl-9]
MRLSIQNFLLKSTGCIFVFLAILGAVLPLLPTTPFLLVAAGCFAKSSPYFHNKLLNSKLFGQLIKDWQDSRSISQKSKMISLCSMALAGAWSCYMLGNIWLKVLVIVLMIGPAIFVYRLPIAKRASK